MGSLESRDELFYFEAREKVSNVGEEGSSISVIDGFILFLFFFFPTSSSYSPSFLEMDARHSAAILHEMLDRFEGSSNYLPPWLTSGTFFRANGAGHPLGPLLSAG